MVPFRLSDSVSSLDINNESKERIQDRRWLIDVKDAAFPPDHIAWLRGYERRPDTPLRQTYHRGIVQQDFDPGAPTIRIGIIVLGGVDIASVTYAEMNRETRKTPEQKSPEWRVATAATLLRRFEVKNDLIITRPDDSLRILQANRQNEPQRKQLLYSDQGRWWMHL